MAHAPGVKAGYTGHRVLPTPDPTVASCISDEDVARQLIALGDASNFSHGRTSASTLEDAFSGVADIASSTGATSDSGLESDDGGLRSKAKRVFEDEDGEFELNERIKNEYNDYEGQPKTKKIKTKAYDGSIHSHRSSKASTKAAKVRANTMPKTSKSSAQSVLIKAPTAPNALGQHRKISSSSTLDLQQDSRGDEEDLSSKPRCQRCRKSKKGCDRQRPCQRCKDAGIGIDGCVSEDEGNGRKGRYGRHMGVTLRKEEGSVMDDDDSQAGAILVGMVTTDAADKSKKRKR